MTRETKHIHFIGICGVAMGALALAFQRNGWKVTGSDKGFYPPVSTHLKDAGVDYYPGWHPEKMGTPDLVIVGNVAGSKNPEWLHVQLENIPYMSYPEAVAEYLIKPYSIVCAGTYGKTTSTTMLSWIMTQAGVDVNYMFGGLAVNDNFPAAMIHDDATWSVVEGDEYKSSRWDTGAKFFHYKPTHILLTSAVWDHADVYPTEESYFQAFEQLIHNNDTSAFLVLSEQVPERIKKMAHYDNVVTYGETKGVDYRYYDVIMTKDGITLKIDTYEGETYTIECPILGAYNADNIAGCFAMAHQTAYSPEDIISALKSFQGVKRRLERRHTGAVDVYDDIAHSPKKAVGVLESIKSLYDGRVIAVFEPNTGNRTSESIPGYDHCFSAADEVIIPRLSRIKVATDDPDPPFDGEKLAAVIDKTHDNVMYMPEDDALVTHLTESTQDGDVIVFLGSHGFRGMIEQVTDTLS